MVIVWRVHSAKICQIVRETQQAEVPEWVGGRMTTSGFMGTWHRFGSSLSETGRLPQNIFHVCTMFSLRSRIRSVAVADSRKRATETWNLIFRIKFFCKIQFSRFSLPCDLEILQFSFFNPGKLGEMTKIDSQTARC